LKEREKNGNFFRYQLRLGLPSRQVKKSQYLAVVDQERLHVDYFYFNYKINNRRYIFFGLTQHKQQHKKTIIFHKKKPSL
jgi:hypothetical protein